jgi:hypothetical protein
MNRILYYLTLIYSPPWKTWWGRRFRLPLGLKRALTFGCGSAALYYLTLIYSPPSKIWIQGNL